MVNRVGATMGCAALADRPKVVRQALAVAFVAGALETFAQRDDHRTCLGLAGQASQLLDQGIGLGTLDVQ
jgi:hypothetical protein